MSFAVYPRPTPRADEPRAAKRPHLESSFQDVWNAYEVQDKHLLLKDMPQLQGLSEEAFDTLVKNNMFGRKVGGFEVKLFCHDPDSGWPGLKQFFCDLRPYPTYVWSTEQFQELVYTKYAARPYREFHVWSEGGCETIEHALTLNSALETLEQCYLYFVAFHINSPAAFARVDPKSEEVWAIDVLESKFGGAGSACLEAVDTYARARGVEKILLSSLNWIATDGIQELNPSSKINPSPAKMVACLTLKDQPGDRVHSLNKYYKQRGFRDTDDACSPEWASVPVLAGQIEAPIQRHQENMSKCLKPYPNKMHRDFIRSRDVLFFLSDAEVQRFTDPRLMALVRKAVARGLGKWYYRVFRKKYELDTPANLWVSTWVEQLFGELNDDACLQFLRDLLAPCASEENTDVKRQYATAIRSVLNMYQPNMRSQHASLTHKQMEPIYQWRDKARSVFQNAGCEEYFGFLVS